MRVVQEELLRQERLAALGQLTGTVAHELRNPLATIATSTAVIERKTRGTDLGLAPSMERVLRNVKRCDGIITELLDFARAKGLDPQPTPLDSWLSQVLGEMRLPDDVMLECDLSSSQSVVDFDRERFRRAIINLVDNASEALMNEDGKGGEIRVATRIQGTRAEVEVADTGPGIPEDLLAKILEPLFSTKTFGVGLGLPTVHRIMEEHGGGLEISNGNHRGTRVLLWLPLDSDATTEDSERWPSSGS